MSYEASLKRLSNFLCHVRNGYTQNLLVRRNSTRIPRTTSVVVFPFDFLGWCDIIAILDTGYWILDAGYLMLDAGC